MFQRGCPAAAGPSRDSVVVDGTSFAGAPNDSCEWAEEVRANCNCCTCLSPDKEPD